VLYQVKKLKHPGSQEDQKSLRRLNELANGEKKQRDRSPLRVGETISITVSGSSRGKLLNTLRRLAESKCIEVTPAV
jgi:hypothetical protein